MQEDVKLKKIDETISKVITDKGICEEISDYYKFWVKNAKWSKPFKEKLWDGFIRLFNKRDQTLPTGLRSSLKDWCEDNSYVYTEEGFDPPEDIQNLETYLKSLNVTSDRKKIDFYDFQIAGVKHALSEKRCILQSPTASGKSLIIYGIINYLLNVKKIKKKILLVVPTISLVSQMTSDFEDYSYENDFDTDALCHQIMGGCEKVSDKKIYVSTWQSIIRLPEKYFDLFDCIICDEAHMFKSSEVKGILEKAKNTPYKIGTTGTTGSPLIDKMQLRALFGEIFVLTTNKEQMEKKRSATIKITALQVVEKDVEIRKIVSGLKYQDEIDYLKASKKRLALIMSLIKKQDTTTLVLFNGNDYGKMLYNTAKKMFPDRNVWYVDGSVSADERERIRKTAAKGTNDILICSFQTFKAGINIKNLNVLIFASPLKAEITILQAIGRILRIGDRMFVTLFDIVDDFSYKKKMNYVLEHFLERLKHYQNEGFDTVIRKIEY